MVGYDMQINDNATAAAVQISKQTGMGSGTPYQSPANFTLTNGEWHAHGYHWC